VSLLPQLEGIESPIMVQYLIGCFIRGLCLESFVSEATLVKKIFDRFVDLLDVYLRESARSRS
jgi:hypothetical protein